MYWRYVSNEIEVVMRVRTHSWVGVGWKSTATTTRCKVLEPVLEVEAKHAEAQRQLLLRQANYTTTEVSTVDLVQISVGSFTPILLHFIIEMLDRCHQPAQRFLNYRSHNQIIFTKLLHGENRVFAHCGVALNIFYHLTWPSGVRACVSVL